MAISVNEIFNKVGLTPSEPVNWKEKLDAKFNGVYLISLSENTESKEDNKHLFKLDSEELKKWRAIAKELSIGDKMVKANKQIVDQLLPFWKPNENILYIGQSTSITNPIQKRVSQFYSHKAGNHGAHSGGYWLKLLSCLNDCKVYFAECEKPRDKEFKMIIHFAELHANKSFYKMDEVALNFPFANLKVDTIKRHDLKKVRKSKKKSI